MCIIIMGKEKKLLIIIVTVLLISNTGTKNVVGLVQCFQAKAHIKHVSFIQQVQMTTLSIQPLKV